MELQKLTENAIVPTKGSDFAAGFDLYACLESPYTIRAKDRGIVPTGIAVSIPTGHFGRISPRSGLAVKQGIDVGAGILDEDFIGQIQVVLFNHGLEDIIFNHGERIAQLIVSPYTSPEIKIVEKLSQTKRGSNGFGSTGK